MKTQTARVVKIIDSDYAEVELSIAPIEEHSCCSPSQSATFIRMKAHNEVGAKAGDMVTVENGGVDTSVGFVALVLAAAVILLIAGYLLWNPWGGFLPLLGIPLIMWLGKHKAKSGALRIKSKQNH